MASPTKALNLVRKARREEAPPKANHFTQYKPAYEKILRETKQYGGDAAMETLGEWMVNEVHRTGKLPEPDVVRRRARRILSGGGHEIPQGSKL